MKDIFQDLVLFLALVFFGPAIAICSIAGAKIERGGFILDFRPQSWLRRLLIALLALACWGLVGYGAYRLLDRYLLGSTPTPTAAPPLQAETTPPSPSAHQGLTGPAPTCEVRTVTIEVTRVVTATPLPAPAVFPLCTESGPPCIHIASIGQYQSLLASLYYGDYCLWPRIFNANRSLDGTYSPVRTGHPYLIPALSGDYLPSVILETGAIRPLVVCQLDPATGFLLTPLPCVYEVPVDAPIYGLAYDEVAARFYGVPSLGGHIRDNNLRSGCSLTGSPVEQPEAIVLEPGVSIVVPARPLE